MADQLEKNNAAVRRWNEVPNTGNTAIYDELAAASYAFRYGTSTSGIKELKAGSGPFREAFPDLQLTLDEMVAEGDKVSVRWTLRGTHKGPILGVAATGKRVTFTGMSLYRLTGGKIVEDWAVADYLGMLQQIGAVRQFG